eukprot:9561069-Ditylum_brightwellii.AAC.1
MCIRDRIGKSFMVIINQGIFATTSQGKWEKFKSIIREWLAVLDNHQDPLTPAHFDLRAMLKGQGILVHLCKLGRDLEGWKYAKKQWLEILEDLDPHTEISDGDAPKI